MIQDTALMQWVSLDTGHSPFLVDPALLARLTMVTAGELVSVEDNPHLKLLNIGSQMDKLCNS